MNSENLEFVNKLNYSFIEQSESYGLPPPLKQSLHLCINYFKNNSNNKLCLVFPSKEYAAQWISVPEALSLIKSDFDEYKGEIKKALGSYQKGQMLIINNEAVVEWIGKSRDGYIFKHKEHKGIDTICIGIKNLSKIQPAPTNRSVLSGYSRVIKAISLKQSNPVDNLLGIRTFGNRLFQKNSICLISRLKSFEESILKLMINRAVVNDYIRPGRIDENGFLSEVSPLIITNNFANLILYLTDSVPVCKIIIDGFNSVTPRGDFSEIDREYNIPIILISDLSEIDAFEEIKNCGFDFFNFTKEHLQSNNSNINSPFVDFERKNNRYRSFRTQKEICHDSDIESIIKLLHSLTPDDTDEIFISLNISLIKLTNLLSRICHIPSEQEISQFTDRISNIQSRFIESQLWLGENCKPIKEIISLLTNFIRKLSLQKTAKCIRLEELVKKNFNYIICPSELEATTLKDYLRKSSTNVISVGDINNRLNAEEKITAILTGWPKSANLNRILNSFLISELTVLFYEYEDRYLTSLKKRNRRNSVCIKPTINDDGSRLTKKQIQVLGFEDMYSDIETTAESPIDIVEFELNLDRAQYSKYSGKKNISESCKAKRIDFENNTFIYASDSHKFLVINELIESVKSHPNIHSRKFEALQTGDVIAFINTDRDVLVELVEKSTKPEEFASIKRWTDLWKNLLRDYFESIDNDFSLLVSELRKYNCKRHPVTIKTWIQDDNRIGPEADEDLMSIALLTQSEELKNNISSVRNAIKQMIGWRMQASEFVRDKIKIRLLEIAKYSILDTTIEIPDLGQVEILKIIELSNKTEEIDRRFIHRLIDKDLFTV